MRKKDKKQLPLMIASVDHPHAVELELISQILNENPIINDLVLQDLTHGVINSASGANGMSAEQVLRAAVIKQMNSYSYEELAFHILDSVCYRQFCHIGFADKGFGKSELVSNPGSHGSRGALALPDVHGKHTNPLKATFGQQLFQQIC